MKLVIANQEAKAVAALAGICGKDKTRPATQCLHIVSNGTGAVKIYSTDTYQLTCYEFGTKDQQGEEYEFSVNAKRFADAIKSCDSFAVLTISEDSDRGRLHIKGINGMTQTLTLDETCERMRPGLEKVFITGESCSVSSLNIEKLHKLIGAFKKVFGGKYSVDVVTREHDANSFTAGDEYARMRSVLMPVIRR